MRVFYLTSDYISHARAGADNKQALEAAGHVLVDDPHLADVAVIHDEPVYYPQHLRRLAGFNLPTVGFCVVETDPMPLAYSAALGLVDEVWTCSEFSKNIIARDFDNVYVVPHVVRRPKLTQGDLARVQAMIGSSDAYTFYTVSDGINPRKNLPALLRAFASLRGNPNYRLVVKQYRKPIDLSGLPGVVSVTEQFTDAEMGALHALCDCYVSPHCSEAWGLSLSEAMAFGNPVVATGYSGNLEFMDEENSLLVKYQESTIRAEDFLRCPPFFTSDMRWAYVDEIDLVAKMLQAPHVDPLRVRNASVVSQVFSPKFVGRLMDRRLTTLASRDAMIGVA